MSCERLVCASCSGLVVEGHCPVCRAAKTQIHHHHHSNHAAQLAAALVLALLVVLLIVRLQLGY